MAPDLMRLPCPATPFPIRRTHKVSGKGFPETTFAAPFAFSYFRAFAMKIPSRLYCGACGWNYGSWRGRFYPEKLPQKNWLSFYADRFDTVEVNNSFYRLPSKETFEHWRDAVGGGFTFAVKASRYLTHLKRLIDPEEPLTRILDNSAGLGDKRGPILYQFPPNWAMDPGRLEHFLKLLPSKARHAFEFRDGSWQNDQVWSLLARYGCAYCVMDSPGLPLHLKTTADFTYIRMHSGKAENTDYSKAELAAWADRVREFLAHGDVYIYFNNDSQAFAVNNALALREMVEGIAG